jgi:methionine synthase II (cobalamin-independent)
MYTHGCKRNTDLITQTHVLSAQVDEPALREGLPLKADRWDNYLTWAVDAFRVTCATAKSETQVCDEVPRW